MRMAKKSPEKGFIKIGQKLGEKKIAVCNPTRPRVILMGDRRYRETRV